ncbi:MAG: hypothetical protein ACREID_06095 [Planctomycetota bacterium]
MKHIGMAAIAAAALAAGLALGQETEKPSEEERERRHAETLEKLKLVRREVKTIDLDATIPRVAAMVAREQEYRALVARIREAATGGEEGVPQLLEQGRTMKLQALAELNDILVLHRGPHAGIEEDEVRRRLETTRLTGVRYRDEWLVNILDDLEAEAKVNIELDARVYKFDVVTFDFEKTTCLAMLQTMADNLLFKWIVRGDTLYVYQERNEVLFDDEWLAKKKAAWKARQDAAARAERDAEGGEAGR